MLIINKTIFESLTSPEYFERFIKALKADGIEFSVIQSPSSIAIAKQPKLDVKHKAVLFHQKEILQAAGLSFKYNYGPHIPTHLSIEFDKQHPSSIPLSQVLNEAILMLRKFGYRQCSVSQNHDSQVINLFPAIGNGEGRIDVRSKIANSLFSFWKIPTSNIQKFKSRRADQSYHSVHFPDEIRFSNINSFKKEVVMPLLQEWLQHYRINIGKPLSPISYSSLVPESSTSALSEVTESSSIVRKITGCAFCRRDVIHNQLVIDVGKALVLVNYLPWGGSKAHIMILPTRHIEDWCELDDAEKHTIYQLVQAISRSIQMTCKIGNTEIFSYLQNGAQAGQSVPHSHMHIFAKPPVERYLINIYAELTNQSLKPLTSEQMRIRGQILAPILYQELLLEQTPQKKISNYFSKIPIEELVIIFDLGNVIADLDSNGMISRLMEKFGFSDLECKQIVTRNHQLIKDYTVGLIDEKNFFQRIAKDLYDIKKGKGGLIKASALKEVWNAEFSVTDKSLKNLKRRLNWIRELKQLGCKILIFSNTNPTHFRFFLNLLKKLKIDARDFFDDMVLSYELLKAKPDPTAYLLLLQQRDIASERVIFLDDRIDNVDGAKRAGIKGIWVKTDLLEQVDELYTCMTEKVSNRYSEQDRMSTSMRL